MPHIIFEYAEDLNIDDRIATVLEAIHHAVADSGLFDPSHVRTRARPFTAYTHADGKGPYMHVQARIKSGRDEAQKKALAEAVLKAVSRQALPAAVLTVEVVDMDSASYAKRSGSDGPVTA